jgi:hypothetical protein
MACTSSDDCEVPEADYTGLVLPITDPSSPVSYYGHMVFDNIVFPLHGESLSVLHTLKDGYFFLWNQKEQYDQIPFQTHLSNGFYCFRIVTDETTLKNISLKVREAQSNNTEYTKFNATNLYVITWNIKFSQTNFVFFQVALCTDGHFSFMIINYKLLKTPSDNPQYLTTFDHKKIYFNGSISGSNCGVPGLLVYQLY